MIEVIFWSIFIGVIIGVVGGIFWAWVYRTKLFKKYFQKSL
jgi:hypothetical protein